MPTYRQQLRGRFATLGIIIIVVLTALLVRLWTIQVLSSDEYVAMAENNRVREISLEAPRGRIYDRNGVELVTNRSALAISVDPAHKTVRALLVASRNHDTADDPTRRELDEVFGELAAMLGMTSAEVFEIVSDVKQEALRPRVVAVDVPMGVVGKVLERQRDFEWARVEEIAVREYPNGWLGAHILGYTGAISEEQFRSWDANAGYELGDTVGQTGAERQFEGVLRGEKGWRRIEVNASGRPQGIVDEQPARPGNDIQLTIDIEVQRVVEEQLAAAIAEAQRQGYVNTKAGAAVVLDIATGEVIAMASAPTYDPSAFLGDLTAADWAKLTDKASEYPLNNRAIMAAYPPASTFKVVTALTGLGAGIVSENTAYRCRGTWTGMGERWPKRCWLRSGHGTRSLRAGMRDSCNVVFYEIGYELYKRKADELQAEARAFGLGSKTGIDLPGEVAGRVPDADWKKEFNRNYPEYQMWLPGDTVDMAIGQGDMLTSPLQMAAVYAGIANGGAVMRPHVLKAVLDSAGEVARTVDPEVLSKARASQAFLDVVGRSLADVTRDGTAEGAFSGFAVPVAGKTGTAEVRGKDNYAWFCAFAPASQPKYALAIVVEQGGSGGSVTGPAARNIVAKLLDQPIVTVRATDPSR